MPYPGSSDWNSGAPLSAFYLHRVSSQPTNACSTTGWDMLRSIQTEVADRLNAYGPLPTYDGTNVDASSVPVNDPTLPPQQLVGWNRDLLRALYALGQRFNISSTYLSALRSDAESGAASISTPTLQTGIWIGDRIYHGFDGNGNELWGLGSPDEVAIPQATTYPQMNVVPPIPAAEAGGTYSTTGQCNAISASAESLIPIARSVVPFQFNPWLILAAIALAAGAAVVMSRDVPVRSETVRTRRSSQRARSNPAAISRTHTRDVLRAVAASPTMATASQFSRNELIAALRLQDPNGIYKDKDLLREGLKPLTKTEAAWVLVAQLGGG